MIDKYYKHDNKITWLLIVLSYFLTYVIVNNSAEIIIFMALVFSLAVAYVISNRGILRIRITAYHIYLLLFCLFCYLSSLWALDTHLAIGKGNTLLEVILLMYVVFLCADECKDPVDFILSAAMWGGILVTLYAIAFYGISGILLVLQERTRVDNTLMNANNLGACAAYSVLIGIYYVMTDRIRLWNVALIPSILILIVSGSRKALLIVVLGIMIFFILRNIDDKNIIRGFFRVIGTLTLLILIMLVLSRLSILEGLETRVLAMIAGLFGGSGADQSTLTRIRLLDIGIGIFKDHPFLGIGMDNATVLTAGLFYKDYYYLHNNFVEMLADGGIVGFILYYSFHLFTLVRFIKYRNFQDKEYSICLTLLIILLIMDYGTVSYLIKSTYVFMMVFYFKTKELKDKKIKERIKSPTSIKFEGRYSWL